MKLIMLADDDPNILALMTEFFKMRGFNVATVQDGTEAIQLAKEEHPDAIIMDIQMPGTYGTSAVKAIRDDESLVNTPVLFLTGVPIENARKIIQEDDKTKLVSKPVDMNALHQMVQDMLGGS